MVYVERYVMKYVKLLEKFGIDGRVKLELYYNIGMLNEILGNFNEVLKYYLMYFKVCKQSGDKKGMVQVYGCLGSVYVVIRNW